MTLLRKIIPETQKGRVTLHYAVVAASALVFAIIWWKPCFGETGDDARMILEARHLWAMWDLRVATDTSHIGMIALLAPLSSSIWVMHLAISAIWIAGVVILYDYGRNITSDDAAFTAALMASMLPVMLVFQSTVMTEIPFFTITVAALALHSRRRWVWAMAIACLALTFRSIGMFLPLAIAIIEGHKLFKRNPKRAVVYTAPGVIITWLFVHWYGRTPSLSILTQGSYYPAISWYEVPSRWTTNIAAYLSDHIPYAFVSNDDFALLGMFFFVVTVAGLASLGNAPLLTYLAGYAGALTVWPDDLSGWRYLVPIMPFFCIAIAHLCFLGPTKAPPLSQKKKLINAYESGDSYLQIGAGPRSLANDIGLRYRHIILGLFVIQSLYFTYMTLTYGHTVNPRWYSYKFAARAFNWPPDAVIAARKSNTMELLSQRKSVGFKFTDDPDLLMSDLDSRGVTHVVIDALKYTQTKKYLIPAIRKHSKRFELEKNFNVSMRPGWLPTPTLVLRMKKDD